MINSPRPAAEYARRQVLRAGGMALLSGAALVACDLSTEPSGSSGEERSGQSKGKEAPQLAKQVQSGDLPPLEDRLPDTPLVVEPTESIGVYGGEWYTNVPEIEAYDAYGKVGYDNLARWDTQWTKVEPNLAESWDINDEGTEFTLHLRAGLKWSDGEPFTADDIVFAYNDVLTDEKLFPILPTWLVVGDERARVEKLDEVTVRVSFATPHGFFLYRLATPDGNVLSSMPKHYLQEFHPTYNPDAEQLAKDEGFASWAELFFAKGGGGLLDLGAWQNTELPTLLAWKVTTPLTGSRLVLERNPYYWKTDPDGSQLPYLDRVVADVGLDPEVTVVNISHGRYSLPDSAALKISDKPVFAQAREQGNFHFVELNNADMNTATIIFNLMHKDPAKREIFANKNFRIAMSHAMNREELIAAVFQQQGEPHQAAPRPESEYYDEELAKQYTEYDPDLANQLLDEAGFDQRNADGMRLRPDGETLSFTLKFMIGWHAYFPDVAERLRAYWREVGADVQILSEEQTKFGDSMPTNTHDVVVYGGDNGMRDAILSPGLYFPESAGSYFAIPWGEWYESQGEAGEEPPEGPRRQMELYDQIKQTVDPDEQKSLFAELLQITRDEFYVMGTVLPEGNYSIVQNNVHNVPDAFPDASAYPDPGPTKPEQFYVAD